MENKCHSCKSFKLKEYSFLRTNCIFSVYHFGICPCKDCIVKFTCNDDDKKKCEEYKKFKKRYTDEAIKKWNDNNFETRISKGKQKWK